MLQHCTLGFKVTEVSNQAIIALSMLSNVGCLNLRSPIQPAGKPTELLCNIHVMVRLEYMFTELGLQAREFPAEIRRHDGTWDQGISSVAIHFTALELAEVSQSVLWKSQRLTAMLSRDKALGSHHSYLAFLAVQHISWY